jgi:isopenicillin-N N-acyltransferase like protein
MKRVFRSPFAPNAICAVLWVIFGASTAASCTLWAASGSRVQGGGTLLAKNRDWRPQVNELRFSATRKGFKYFGIFSKTGKSWHVRAGVNEMGLSVVSATAGSVERSQREPGIARTNESILSHHESVAGVLNDTALLSRGHPAFFLISDRKETALIQVAPHGKYTVSQQADGLLFQTNHYTAPDLVVFNSRTGRSSQTRIGRVQQLLDSHPTPFSVEDFISISTDKLDGPDNSIWRTGKSPHGNRTLASWIIHIPQDGPPVLSVRLANPDESEKTHRLILDQGFWSARR